ncbi:MAG TPA: gamma-glutamyltransferase, partial [Bacteroidota bacterium]|nr:gamma-glutamyltransferase [Bacteroidota bacterium]
RERAPLASTRDMYLDRSGNPVPEKSLLGTLSAGVPGTVDGLLTALNEYGTLGKQEVLSPAIDLAETGFPVGEHLAHSLHSEIARFSSYPSTMAVFTRNGLPFRPGDTLRQSDLASTLRAIRDRGAEGFYTGQVADEIVSQVRRDGGIITAEDLRDYQAVERDPVIGSYRGYDIITAAPPSSGGIILLEILNILERFDLREMGWNSSRTLHTFASACQRAYADRSVYMGDPDFVSVPTEELISKEYAERRSSGVEKGKALRSFEIREGDVSGANHQTTHYCVADRWGNVVSVTYTLNDLYGCKAVVEGAGFFLNDEMDDFTVKAGARNLFSLVGGVPNEIEPGKRMLSSMTPTIVLKENRPFLVLGARGGSRIPTTVAQIICNTIDFGMTVQEAVDAPRLHDQWVPDTLFYERFAIPKDVIDNMKSMGYSLSEVYSTAHAQAIMIDSAGGYFLGGPDPRDDGVAIGY